MSESLTVVSESLTIIAPADCDTLGGASVVWRRLLSSLSGIEPG